MYRDSTVFRSILRPCFRVTGTNRCLVLIEKTKTNKGVKGEGENENEKERRNERKNERNVGNATEKIKTNSIIDATQKGPVRGIKSSILEPAGSSVRRGYDRGTLGHRVTNQLPIGNGVSNGQRKKRGEKKRKHLSGNRK